MASSAVTNVPYDTVVVAMYLYIASSSGLITCPPCCSLGSGAGRGGGGGDGSAGGGEGGGVCGGVWGGVGKQRR